MKLHLPDTGTALRGIALTCVLALLACHGTPDSRPPGTTTPVPVPDSVIGIFVGIPQAPRPRRSRLQPRVGVVTPMTDHRDDPPEETNPFPNYYREPGEVFGRSYTLDPLKTEYIDSYTGRLRLKYTDLRLPGRGLPIEVVRTYHNHSNPEGILGLNILDGRNATGAGWDMHFGRVHMTFPVGKPFCRTGRLQADRNPILELPDGTRKVLFDADDGAPYPLTTKDRWVASCVDGHHVVGLDEYNDGGLLVISPDGTKYTIDWLGRVRAGDTHQVWSVTRIEDRNGNWLKFSYLDRTTHQYTLLDNIEASDGRRVYFKYDAAPSGGPKSATPLLTHIHNQDSSREWRYLYTAMAVPGQFHLTGVVGPADLRWTYSYHQPGDPGLGGYSVKEVINPYGGKTTYDYQLLNLKPAMNAIPIQAVEKKTTSGLGLKTGEWQYNFLPQPAGTNMAFTEVVGPTTRVLYEHCSLRALILEQKCAGQQGQVLVKETFKRLPLADYSEAQPLQRETFIWGFLKIGRQYEPIQGTGILEHIDATYHHVMARKTTFRNGEYYSTAQYDEDDYGNVRFKMEFRDTSPPPPYCWTQDDYDCAPAGSGCDLCTVSGGTKRRDTEYTYHTDPSRWIVNLKKNELLYERCAWLNQEPSKPAFCDARNSFLSGVVRRFDEKGNLAEQHSHNHADKTLFTYYPNGELKTKTDPEGNVYSYSDYYRGIPRREDHPEGITIRRTVDDNGNVASQTDGRNNTSNYGYDGLGRVISIETPRATDANITVSWDWSDGTAGGKPTRTVKRGTHEDQRRYDAFGRELSRTVGGITLTFDYDEEGRRTFASYPGSAEGTKMRYDPLGRLIEREHSADGKTFRYRYLDDNVTEMTNERGKITRYHYRAFGNPSESALIKTVAPDGLETTIKRHQSGAVYAIVQGDCDVHCRTRYFVRDDRYRVRIQTNPETGAHKLTHDENGNVITSLVDGTLGKPDGEISGITQRHYDGLNRLRRVDYPSGTLPVVFTYNKVNKTETVTRGDIKWHYQYDENNNFTRETLTAEKRTFQLAYAYDAQDALASMTLPSGLVVEYAPDALGRPTKAAPYVTSLSYHPNGEVQQMVYQNGKTTTIGIDPRQRLATISAPGAVDLRYSYDEVSNVTSIVDALDNANNRVMTYDDRDRLETVSGLWGAGTFSYNEYGDIIGKTIGGITQSYQYGGDNRATKLSYVSGDSFIGYFYDVYGNVKQRGTALFAYDDSGQVTSFKPDADSLATLYAYDGKGHRTVETATNGEKRISIYNSAGHLVYEDQGCAQLRTDHIRVGRMLVASRKQTCAGDTDGDMIPDCAELCGGIDPLVKDADEDPDGDGLTNLEEYQAKTLFQHSDSDGDTLTDKEELDGGTNPLSADSDHDGLGDGEEIILGSNPMAADSDGDGMLDGFEVDIGLDPLADDGSEDSDGDGFSNLVETLYGSDPNKAGSTPLLDPPGTLRWSYDSGSTSSSQATKAPLMAAGGTIIGFGSTFGLDWKGTELWKTPTNYGTGTVTAGGALVVGSGKSITAVDAASGETLWVYSAGDVYHRVLALGPNDTLYVRSSEAAGHHVRALNANTGKEIWSADGFTAINDGATVGPDGTVYVLDAIDSMHDVVAALSPVDGARLWSHDPQGELYGPMALGMDGSIYLRGKYSVYALNADGTKKWVFTAPDNLYSAPVVGTNGTIFVGGSNAIYAVHPDGKQLWTQDIRTGGMGSGQVKAMAVAKDGIVYYSVAGQRDQFGKERRGWVRAVVPKTGQQLWTRELTAHAHGFTVGTDGSLAVATFNCHVQNDYSCIYEAKTVVIAGQAGGLAPSSWPAGGHDSRQSNYLTPCDTRDGDSDSIPDCVEERVGLDPQKQADGDADPDGDGLTNAEEHAHKTHFYAADSDGDGIGDRQEIDTGLNPRSSDSDGDGMDDGFELEHGLDPEVDDATVDSDGDGFDNAAEHKGGSDPRDRWSVPLGQSVWSFDAGNSSSVPPIIGTDGYLYFSASNRVYRFIPKMPYQEPEIFYTADKYVTSLMYGNNTLHVVSAYTITAVNQDGTARWVFPSVGGKFSGTPRRPAMAADGTVYQAVQSRSSTLSALYAIKTDGSLLWTAKAPETYTDFGDPSVGADGTIYVGYQDGSDGNLVALDPTDGSTKWSPSAAAAITAAPAIAPDGNILFTSSSCQYALRATPTGDVSRHGLFTGFCSWLSAPTIANNGYMYTVAGSRSRYIWKARTNDAYPTDERSVVMWWNTTAGTVASKNGTLFLVSSIDEVVAVDLNGTPKIRWKSPDLGTKLAAPVMARDGTLFVMGSKLYAIPTRATGLDDKWPMLGRDPGRTGNITTPIPEQNVKPVVTITAPSGSIAVAPGARITLEASASDAEDGDLGAAISWTSSLRGALGNGPSLSKVLSAGTHVISASVTDSGNASHTAKVLVHVRPTIPRATSVTLAGGPNSYWTNAGTTIDFVANAGGGSGSYEYRFVARQAGVVTLLRSWSADNTLAWDTSGRSGWNDVTVYARSIGQVQPAVTHTRRFLVYGVGSASAVTLSTDKVSPQPAGTTVNFTAAASGSGSNYEYIFEHYVAQGTHQWVPLRGWSTDATFEWDTTGWTGTRHVRVRARGVGIDQPAVAAYRVFQLDLTDAATAVRLTATPAQYSVTQNATVEFNAVANGGSGDYEYQFELKDQTRTVVQNWSDNASWSWIADTIGKYEVTVYARAKAVAQEAVYAVSYHGVVK